MELFKIAFKAIGVLFFTCGVVDAAFPPEVSAQVLYFVHQGKSEQAFTYYLDYSNKNGVHDFELLQQAAQNLLEEGTNSKDADIQTMCLFGAGVSGHPASIPILEKGIHSKDPKRQLIALNFISRFQDDEADLLLMDALSSPFLLTRLEAALQLALKKDPSVIEQLESLLFKVPKPARGLFPQIIAPLESPEASKFLRQFLTDPMVEVRIETILQAAENGYDDLLPSIRAIATHPDTAEQESCAIAFGLLKDELSLPQLQKWKDAKQESLCLAALKSLDLLGDTEAQSQIEKIAENKNPFAFFLLKKTATAKSLLTKFLSDSDPNIQLNALFCLLQWHEPVCVSHLKEILIRSEKDLGFLRISSPGKGLTAWKIIPHALQKSKTYPQLMGLTRRLREKTLRLTLELPENDFLQVAKMIFDHRQMDLVPLLVELLSNHRSEATLQLLKEQQQKTGAPLIRNYCNLALYRLQEKGPYEENLLRWIKEEHNQELIRFREENETPDLDSTYSLTPEETSQLLIESFETLAAAQNAAGIEALVRAIANGNPKNRYALAGLLMRMSE